MTLGRDVSARVLLLINVDDDASPLEGGRSHFVRPENFGAAAGLDRPRNALSLLDIVALYVHYAIMFRGARAARARDSMPMCALSDVKRNKSAIADGLFVPSFEQQSMYGRNWGKR